MSEKVKIEIGYNKIHRLNGLDELAKLLFPHNKKYQKTFLAIFIEIKYAPDQIIPDFKRIPTKFNISYRILEKVRAKARKMGLIDHISRFSTRYGFKDGWTFSKRFTHSLQKLGTIYESHKQIQSDNQEQKDRDCLNYI